MTINAAHRRGPCASRGMTLLEVVLAIAALGLVGASASATMSYLYGAQVREQRRLGACELAHRLVLIRLDNPNDLPSASEAIPYARDLFRYEMEEASVELKPREHVARTLFERRSDSSIDRLEQITVRVWLSEESGGSSGFDTTVPNATLIRLHDPYYLHRNPDASHKLFRDDVRRSEAIRMIVGSG